MAKSKKKKGNGLSLNFKDVKVMKTPPEGQYLVEVTSVTEEVSSNDNPMLSWEFEIATGKHKGSKLWYTTTLNKESLWKLREILEALGQEVPDGKMDLDLDDLIGCQAGVNVLHEVYEGKTKAKIADWLDKDEVEEDDEDTEEDDSDDEEEDTKSSKKKKKASKDDDEEEESEEDEEETEVPDVSKMNEDELAEVIEEHGLEIDLDDYSSIKKKRAAVEEAFESSEETEEESEDGDEEEAQTYSEEQIDDMDLEALEELNTDLELEVDMDDLSVKKARKAILKALKKAGLLED